MADRREIQSRIKSIQDTMKITNAMYMISSTKLAKARRAQQETEPYFYTLQSMVSRIVRHMPKMEHLYFGDGRNGGRTRRGYLVVTGDKGMAGAYNHNVLALARQEQAGAGTSMLFVVGEVGRQYFHSQKIQVDEHFLYTAQNPTMGRARAIAAKLLELYESGGADEIDMIYSAEKNGMQVEPKLVRLLPLSREDFRIPRIPVNVPHEEFSFYPSPEEVLNHVVPNYIAGYVFGALIESYCSEHSARMMAMKTAGDNGREMIRALSVEYNRVRQAAITREITEVVSGAKAQKRELTQRSKGAGV